MNQMRTPQLKRRGDSGETLLEVLIAFLILGGAIAALLAGLSTAILNSAAHRKQATANTVLRSYAEAVKDGSRVGYICATGGSLTAPAYQQRAGWQVNNRCGAATLGYQQVTIWACPPGTATCTEPLAPFRMEIGVRQL